MRTNSHRSASRALVLFLALGVLAFGAPVAHAWSAWEVGDLRRVSTTAAGEDFYSKSESPVMSADGRFVVFASAANLVSGLKASINIFRRNLVTGEVRLVSSNAVGDPANRASSGPDVSADGRYVVFRTAASNLTPIGPEKSGIFVKDMATGAIDMLSVSQDGVAANGDATGPTISPDATRIAFASDANNLVANDDNGWSDIFVVNRTTDVLRLVSTDLEGGPSNNHSHSPVIANGGRVLFSSLASDLSASDKDACEDLFVWQPDGSRQLVNLPCTGWPAPPHTISGDGRVVAYDRTVLRLGSGARWTPSSTGEVLALSGTGRFATFHTLAPLVPRDTNGLLDVYIRDLTNGSWKLATVSSGGDVATEISSNESSLSGDGSYLAFTSWDTDLVRGDDNEHRDIFVARLK